MKREDYISDEMVVKRVDEAVRIELEKKSALDVPIVTYDRVYIRRTAMEQE